MYMYIYEYILAPDRISRNHRIVNVYNNDNVNNSSRMVAGVANGVGKQSKKSVVKKLRNQTNKNPNPHAFDAGIYLYIYIYIYMCVCMYVCM